MNNKNKKYNPPKLLMIFLKWFCSEKYYEEVSGDLIELFEMRAEKGSFKFNRIKFFLDMIKFFRPLYWKKSLFHYDGSLIMFKSYIKFAIRNFVKHKFNSAINIIGLTVGIASLLYICSYVFFELSYDKHFYKSDQLYRVITDASFMGKNINTIESSTMCGKVFPEEIPEIEISTMVTNFENYTITYDNNTIKESEIAQTDSNFFKIFNTELIYSTGDEHFKDKKEIYLARSFSQKFFGDQNPVDKILKLDFRSDYIIKGVYEDFPSNSHFKPKALVTSNFRANDTWTNFNAVFYFRLIDNANPDEVQIKIDKINEKYLAKDFQKFGINMENFKKSGNRYDLKLQSVRDIHLNSHLADEFEENTDLQYITIFSVIGVFILILAAVNFINLSTARSSLRAKEVGIKKAIGSTRKELIQQFLTESVFISLISFLIAVLLISFGFDYLNSISGVKFDNLIFSNFIILPSLFTIVILMGIFAGSFPAFVLSKFSPVKVFRNTFTSSSKSKFRNGLVIFQFIISIILIVGTLVVFEQLEYIKSKKLGYDKEQMLVVQDAYIARNGLKTFKEKVKSHQNVINATISSYLPVGEYRQTNGIFPDGKKNDPRVLPMQSWNVDYDYISTLGLKIVSGRDFNKEIRSDSNAVIINQACLKHFGFEKPFEHYLSRGGSSTDLINYKIIGVVENFHFESLKESIKPIILRIGHSQGYITLKIKNNIPETIKFLKENWEASAPGKPFSYKFLDESFNNLYFSEIKTGKLFALFAVLAIFIASLGLLGLVAFTVERKTKEIGIRKVMGASTFNVIKLMIRDFVILVSAAFVVSIPIAYYALNNWLDNYAYRTDISMSVFIIAGLISFIIAIGTVMYHSIKASGLNPIETIKYE